MPREAAAWGVGNVISTGFVVAERAWIFLCLWGGEMEVVRAGVNAIARV